MKVTRLKEGLYRVADGDRLETVYVAGPAHDRWVFWNGETYRVRRDQEPTRRASRIDAAIALTAPMPATVLKIVAGPGTSVKKGGTILILEAMKMELPIRAPVDAQVSRILCKEGDIVQPDVVLVDLK
jgi:3-methylcrotonyl-CoA carboxylase alpha subunit